jgi:hypothetical protein
MDEIIQKLQNVGKMKSDNLLVSKLFKLYKKGLLLLKFENNPYLKYYFKGNGKVFPEAFEVKIYSSNALVCNNVNILQRIKSEHV